MSDTQHQREQARIAEKRQYSSEPNVEGLPEEEGFEGTDINQRLDEDPVEAPNRRDVPDTPENSIEARTEDE